MDRYMKSLDFLVEAMEELLPFIEDKIKFNEINKKRNHIKKNNNVVIDENYGKNFLNKVDYYNAFGIRLFYKEDKMMLCFFTPGIKKSSVKYSIRRKINDWGEKTYLLEVKGKYEDIIESIMGGMEKGALLTKTKIALPQSEFFAKFEIDKKIWDFNKIEKVVNGGLICFVFNKKNKK